MIFKMIYNGRIFTSISMIGMCEDEYLIEDFSELRSPEAFQFFISKLNYEDCHYNEVLVSEEYLTADMQFSHWFIETKILVINCDEAHHIIFGNASDYWLKTNEVILLDSFGNPDKSWNENATVFSDKLKKAASSSGWEVWIADDSIRFYAKFVGEELFEFETEQKKYLDICDDVDCFYDSFDSNAYAYKYIHNTRNIDDMDGSVEDVLEASRHIEQMLSNLVDALVENR